MPEDNEAKRLIRDWCKMQEDKYGPDWKKIVAKEMAEKTAPFVKALFDLGSKK